MIRKENNKIQKFIFGFFLAIFLILTIWYRNSFSELFLNLYTKYFNSTDQSKIELSLTEREELEKLRVENETLKDNISDLQNEISLIEDGLEPTYVKMLGKNKITNLAADYYGSFYITYPKDKTAYKGMLIYSYGNVIVGKVEEVLQNSLFVTRLGQNTSFLAESGEENEQLELSSLGNGLYVGNLAAGSKIAEGDQVVLRGYPKAVVGVVSEIAKSEDTLSTIFVRAPYNLYNKEIFYILQ